MKHLIPTLGSVVGALVLAVHGCATATSGDPEALAPGLSFPIALAEGQGPEQGAADAGAAPPDGGSPAAPAAAAARHDLTDPAPLMLERQWEYELLYDGGEVSVTNVRPLLYEHPVATPRRMGRYALELWIGDELIDRVRFDFPGLAAEPPPSGPRKPLHEPPSLAPGAVVSRKVLVPASPRATRAVLVDRATGVTLALPWPPDAPLDAGAPVPVHEPDGGTG